MEGTAILYSGWLSVPLCRAHIEKVFVFGDNLRRVGMGGQAVIRHMPNALGVATKRRPAMTASSFFEEGNDDDLDAVLDDLALVYDQLRSGKTVVIPVTTSGEVSLGLERARLQTKAPSIYKTISTHVEEMVACYGNGRILGAL